MGSRIALLFSIVWVTGLTRPLSKLVGREFVGRDLFLIIGGFLLAVATPEVHEKLEGEEDGHGGDYAVATFAGVLTQMALPNLVFSLGSMITAVGMADELAVMVISVILAVGVMMLSAEWIADFVGRHPTVTMLALSFLLLTGMSLLAEGMGLHTPKGHINFAMDSRSWSRP
jgi:predicted tellurium resistance membrane protein TerC